jgi:hypothetical protein
MGPRQLRGELVSPVPPGVAAVTAVSGTACRILESLLVSDRAKWPAVDDGGAVVSYGVGALPESFLVDPQGTIIAKFDGQVTAAGLDSIIGSEGVGT